MENVVDGFLNGDKVTGRNEYRFNIFPCTECHADHFAIVIEGRPAPFRLRRLFVRTQESRLGAPYGRDIQEDTKK